jgi:hypothetical protein
VQVDLPVVQPQAVVAAAVVVELFMYIMAVL